MTVKIFDAPYGDNFDASLWYSNDGKGNTGKCLFTSEYRSWLSCDWLVVTDTPHSCFYTDIPKERRILFIVEPPEVRNYISAKYYIEQFGFIVSQYDIPSYTGKVIISSPCLGWTAGSSGVMNSLNKALAYTLPEKTKALSIITSLKQKTTYQKRRIKFLREAQKEFVGVLDCYGRDFNPIDDKLKAIAPYKYHLVIENSRLPNYWTEKLIDAWAGWALPVYCGAPNILEHIPDKNGIEIIDVDNIPSALKKIHELIDDDVYSSRLEAIKICREWALKSSNRYVLASKIVEQSGSTTPKLKTPELFKIIISPWKNRVYNLIREVSGKLADKIFLDYCRRKGRLWE